MFAYLNDTYTKPEQLLLTLYQVGAMAQSDLTTILGWGEKRTSEVIISLNGGRKKNRKDGLKKVGEIREHSGKRISGKIRFLSQAGLEHVASLTGLTEAFSPLNEGELRSAANLTKFVVEFAKHNPSGTYYGPYLAKIRFSFDDLRSEFPTCLEIEDYVLWLIWISEATEDSTIRSRLEEWRFIRSKVTMINSTLNHQVVAVCSTTNVVKRVLNQVKRVKTFPLHATTIEEAGSLVVGTLD